MTEPVVDKFGRPFEVGATVVFLGWHEAHPNIITSGTGGVIREIIDDQAQVDLFDDEGRMAGHGAIPLSCLQSCSGGQTKWARDLYELRRFHLLGPLRSQQLAFDFWVDGFPIGQLDQKRLEALAVAVDYHLTRLKP